MEKMAFLEIKPPPTFLPILAKEPQVSGKSSRVFEMFFLKHESCCTGKLSR
jgi:hypothetical protein